MSQAVTPAETRILDATKLCCERWGIAKVGIDDIAAEAGVSRATLYRMFPGGKDVVFDALRVREMEEFFTELKLGVIGATDLEDIVVRTVVVATQELRADEHLAIMQRIAVQPKSISGRWRHLASCPTADILDNPIDLRIAII